MTNEAVKVELDNETGCPRRFTCLDSVAITKGSILQLIDPRVASQANTLNQPIAGIAAMDKVASDGSTSITAWTNGVFELKASGAIAAGAPVGIAGTNNLISLAPTTASGAVIIGYALETAADAEVINVRVKL